MKTQILDKIHERHVSSNGKCGILPVDICSDLGIDYRDIKETLNEMHQENMFEVRKGINGHLLFKK